MAEMIDESSALESTTVGVFRTAATVKGGRRFSFSSLVVVGDRNGRVGFGYGKANQVPPAIEKAQKDAKRKMRAYPLEGRTIPHAVTGRFGACHVRMIPASPGTGVIAGAAARAPLEMLGIQDCLTKSYGSSNPKNLVKAVINGLGKLRSKEAVESLRGVELEATTVQQSIESGLAFMPEETSGESMKAPVNTVGQERSGGRGGRRGGPGGGRGRGGGGGGRGREEAPPATEGGGEAPAAESTPPSTETPSE
jgi:small subunit ribosomal protein S5